LFLRLVFRQGGGFWLSASPRGHKGHFFMPYRYALALAGTTSFKLRFRTFNQRALKIGNISGTFKGRLKKFWMRFRRTKTRVAGLGPRPGACPLAIPPKRFALNSETLS
jgi:hypothetical protein